MVLTVVLMESATTVKPLEVPRFPTLLNVAPEMVPTYPSPVPVELLDKPLVTPLVSASLLSLVQTTAIVREPLVLLSLAPTPLPLALTAKWVDLAFLASLPTILPPVLLKMVVKLLVKSTVTKVPVNVLPPAPLTPNVLALKELIACPMVFA
jgi:hypothetical protein